MDLGVCRAHSPNDFERLRHDPSPCRRASPLRLRSSAQRSPSVGRLVRRRRATAPFCGLAASRTLSRASRSRAAKTIAVEDRVRGQRRRRAKLTTTTFSDRARGRVVGRVQPSRRRETRSVGKRAAARALSKGHEVRAADVPTRKLFREEGGVLVRLRRSGRSDMVPLKALPERRRSSKPRKRYRAWGSVPLSSLLSRRRRESDVGVAEDFRRYRFERGR